MAYFNRDTSNRGGRDNRGGGRGFGGRPTRNDGPREMFKTTCSSCGKECEVPFKPTNGKPVYCSECFDRISPRTDKQSLPFQGRSERSERPSFDRNDRPRRDDGPRRDDRPQTPRVDYGQQFEALNAKMDKLITLLTPKEAAEVPEVSKVSKVTKVKKAKVVKEVE